MYVAAMHSVRDRRICIQPPRSTQPSIPPG